MPLTLTKRQRRLMLCDCYAEYDEDSPINANEPNTRALRAELRAGRKITVSAVLLSELREFADRDADPSEHQMYKRLLVKATNLYNAGR